MKILLLVFVLITSISSYACEHFAGDYLTSDGQPVKITQVSCDMVTLFDTSDGEQEIWKLELSGEIYLSSSHEEYEHPNGGTVQASEIHLASILKGRQITSKGYLLIVRNQKRSSLELTFTLLEDGNIKIDYRQELPESGRTHTDTSILTKVNL